MDKKFKYKTPTGAASESAPGVVLFDKVNKTIKIGGDEMYPNFSLGSSSSLASLSFSGNLASQVISSDATKYAYFLNRVGLANNSNIDNVALYYDANVYYEVTLKNSESEIVEEALQNYPTTKKIEIQYTPENVVFYDCIISVNNYTVVSDSGSKAFGLIYSTNTASTINALTSLNLINGTSTALQCIYSVGNGLYVHNTNSGTSYTYNDFSDLFLEVGYNLAEGDTLTSFGFYLSYDQETSLSFTCMDEYGSNLGTVYPTAALSRSLVFSYSEGNPEIVIDGNDHYFTFSPIGEYAESYNETKVKALLGIYIDFTNAASGDTLDIEYTPGSPASNRRGGTVPAPTSNNQILTSTGWQTAGSIAVNLAFSDGATAEINGNLVVITDIARSYVNADIDTNIGTVSSSTRFVGMQLIIGNEVENYILIHNQDSTNAAAITLVSIQQENDVVTDVIMPNSLPDIPADGYLEMSVIIKEINNTKTAIITASPVLEAQSLI